MGQSGRRHAVWAAPGVKALFAINKRASAAGGAGARGQFAYKKAAGERRKAPPAMAPLARCPQALARSITLYSPLAIFFCHSAGPVMWALVPPASTATVTGMSTTSNS